MKHPHCDLIKAWADGATIEIQLSSGHWNELERPSWLPSSIYRIKPEPKPDRIAYWVYSCGEMETYNTKQMLGSIYADQLKVVFDGQTGVIKSVEVL